MIKGGERERGGHADEGKGGGGEGGGGRGRVGARREAERGYAREYRGI